MTQAIQMTVYALLGQLLKQIEAFLHLYLRSITVSSLLISNGK